MDLFLDTVNYPILVYGLLLLGYGLATTRKPALRMDLLERAAAFASPIAAMAAVILTGLSIYLPVNHRAPVWYSLFLTGPVLLFASGYAFYRYVKNRGKIDRWVLEGLAICALSAQIFRLY